MQGGKKDRKKRGEEVGERPKGCCLSVCKMTRNTRNALRFKSWVRHNRMDHVKGGEARTGGRENVHRESQNMSLVRPVPPKKTGGDP